MNLSIIISKLQELSEDNDNDTVLKDVFTEEEIDALIENIDQLDELSKNTLKSYIAKAASDVSSSSYKAGRNRRALDVKGRLEGISKASDKLTKRGLYQKTKDKMAAAKSMNEASEAEDTMRPNSRPGDTRSEMLNAMLALTPMMSIEDLSHMYDEALAITSAAANVQDDSEKNKASIAMKEDITAMFQGQELTEEFKDKAAIIFEAAVNAKVIAKATELEDTMTEVLEEEIASAREEMVIKLDAYLDHVADKYIEENQLAIVSTLKSELTEDFLSGLKNLFMEHNIDIPDSKIDMVEELTDKVASLEDALDKVLQEKAELETVLEDASKIAAIEESSKGLTVAQAAKFKQLAEAIEFDVDFEDKLDVIKESYFTKAPKNSNILTEEFEGNEVQSTGYTDPTIKLIADRIGRTIIK